MKKHMSLKQLLVLMAGLYFVFQVAILGTSCKHKPLLEVVTPPDTIGVIDTVPQGIPCDPDTVYFETQVLPILISNCAMSGCHNAASHEEDVILDNFANVVQTGKVKPFNPGDSKLYKVITDNDPEDRMPQPPAPALTQDQIQLIAKWINQGAQNLACDPNSGGCDSLNVSYSTALKPIIDTNCKGCHSGASPSGGISLETYNSVKTVALNGKLYGTISWSSGYVKMPQGANQLDACTIAKFNAWIGAGAPEN